MTKPRARDLGIPFEGTPASLNAITDVAGVEVGYSTIISGEAVRTGVTIIHPRGRASHQPVFAGWHALNGNGEMTGTTWIEEGGFIEGAVGLTNTHSVGILRDTIIAWEVEHQALVQRWSMPVVAETADGWLNDMNAFHVKPEHALAALNTARGGTARRGQRGRRHRNGVFRIQGRHRNFFAASLPDAAGGYTLGVLVQANFGRRLELTIAGAPVGRQLLEYAPFAPHQPHEGRVRWWRSSPRTLRCCRISSSGLRGAAAWAWPVPAGWPPISRAIFSWHSPPPTRRRVRMSPCCT